MPHDSNVIPVNFNRQGIAHFALLVHHIALELRLFERNNPDASPEKIAESMASHFPHVADDIRANYNFVKAFIEQFDGAVNNPASGGQEQ